MARTALSLQGTQVQSSVGFNPWLDLVGTRFHMLQLGPIQLKKIGLKVNKVTNSGRDKADPEL